MTSKHVLSGPPVNEFLRGPLGTTATWVCKNRDAARRFQTNLHARMHSTNRAVRTRTVPTENGHKLIATLIERNHSTSDPEMYSTPFARACPWVAGFLAVLLVLELLRVVLQ